MSFKLECKAKPNLAVEFAGETPYLTLTGPEGSGERRMLRLLGLEIHVVKDPAGLNFWINGSRWFTMKNSTDEEKRAARAASQWLASMILAHGG